MSDEPVAGIIMCELIARVDADPDILPRTANFGVDYIAFSSMCQNCPPDFLKLAFTCVKVCTNAEYYRASPRRSLDTGEKQP